MESLFKSLDAGLVWLNGYLWGPPLLVLLLGTHLFLTIRLRFIQRYVGLAIKLSVSRETGAQGDVSPFGALTTALAATVGTGNIVGVATAVALGGPGAVLWCWLTGVFGIATKYSEAVLSVKYRQKTEDGRMIGGPMYALEKGLGWKWAGMLFAVFTGIAAFGIGNMVQANSLARMTLTNFGISPWITGAVITLLTGGVILGGIKSIARVCEALVPIMVAFYLLGCLLILALGWQTLPDTVALIFKSAFTGQAATGGFAGSTIMMAARYGVARGLFSNESGLGSAPIVAAAAQTRNPVRQALVSSSGTFWDTVVVCLITGLVLVNTGAWQADLSALGSDRGVALTSTAFASLHSIGPIILNVGLVTFVFSTIIGWSYYGERAVEYLLGPRAIIPYRVLWVVACMVGSVASMPLVWNFADAANAMMAIPNLISLLLLSGVIVRETRKYLWSGGIELSADSEESPGS